MGVYGKGCKRLWPKEEGGGEDFIVIGERIYQGVGFVSFLNRGSVPLNA